MNTDRIDFISAYCDRWCERCPFTSRCSTFAASAAIAMCGDLREGLELAIGAPHPVGPELPSDAPHERVVDIPNIEMTAEESAEYHRRKDERDVRIRESSIMKVAWAVTMLSYRWFSVRDEQVFAGADIVLKEAIEVARYDASFVTAKLHRALDGRDRHGQDDEGDDHPVQNDWNGSAKVALISLERSAAAWGVIAQAMGDESAGALAERLRDLQCQVERAFPNAQLFVRPGFDQPDR